MIAEIKPYFRDIIDGLGYEEHRDFINFENIPGTIIDDSYHIEIGTINPIAVDQLVYTLNAPVTIRLFKRGYNDTVQAQESLIQSTDTLLAGVLDPTIKLNAELFNVVPGTINYVQLSFSNDNWIVAEVSFVATIKLCF